MKSVTFAFCHTWRDYWQSKPPALGWLLLVIHSKKCQKIIGHKRRRYSPKLLDINILYLYRHKQPELDCFFDTTVQYTQYLLYWLIEMSLYFFSYVLLIINTPWQNNPTLKSNATQHEPERVYKLSVKWSCFVTCTKSQEWILNTCQLHYCSFVAQNGEQFPGFWLFWQGKDRKTDNYFWVTRSKQ